MSPDALALGFFVGEVRLLTHDNGSRLTFSINSWVAVSVCSERVTRCGAWGFFAPVCRASYRDHYVPDLANHWGIGFRVALTDDAVKQGGSNNVVTLNDPAFQQWMNDVQALPAEEQVEAVLKKLVELNPGFDGKVTVGDGHGVTKIEDGVVKEFAFFTDHVTDISPVRALPDLRNLCCTGSITVERNGKLADLSPLRGMRLEMLGCFGNPISDLSPLRGIPLKTLHCDLTVVADLSPLRGSQLTKLTICGTEVSDQPAGDALKR